MFRQMLKYCWPNKRMLSRILIGSGLLLLLLFVPLQIWMALIGCILLVLGIFLTKKS